MNKVKKSKKKVDSEDEYSPQEDIVYSEVSANQQQLSYDDANKEDSSSKKKLKQAKKNEKTQQQGLCKVKKLSITQIKEQILIHTPDMREQIDILDDDTLKEIYYSIVEPNQKGDIEEQQSKINYSSNNSLFEEQKQSATSFQQSKSKTRNPQIQRMLQEIVKSVPHMKNQVETFDDEEIRELYQSVGLFPNDQPQNQPEMQHIPSSANTQDIRKFLQQKIPQMKDELKYLQDEDLLQVYEQYAEKEKPMNQNRHLSRPSQDNFQSQQIFNNSNSRMQMINDPHQMQMYDPLKKFQSTGKNSVKLEPSAFQQGSPGWFNNYKYGGQNRVNDPLIPTIPNNKAMNQQNSYFSPPSNSFQVHNFHNSQRVSSLPYNPQNCARTVVIFHTMDPGYVPRVPKSRCRCSCCLKRENQMNDPDALNGFFYEMMNKYALRK